MDKSSKSTILGLLAILVWTTTSAVCRTVVEYIGPCMYTGISCGSAGILLWSVNAIRQRSLKRSLTLSNKWYLKTPLFITYFVLFGVSYGITHSREASIHLGLINYLWPPLIVLFSVFILQQKPRWAFLIIGTLVALLGISITILKSPSDISGMIIEAPLPSTLMLFAAISWALYSNLIRKYKTTSFLSDIATNMLITGTLLIITSIILEKTNVWNLRVIIELSYAILFPTTLGYLFWDIGMKEGNNNVLATTAYILPVASTAISAIYWNIPLESQIIIGSTLVMGGAIISKQGIQSPTSTKRLR